MSTDGPKAHLWKKGQSGNPLGKPKGSAGLAARIQASTKGGKTLLAVANAVIADPKSTATEKLAAVKWLADRAFGKAEATVNLNANVIPAAESNAKVLDYKSLSNSEFREFCDISKRLDALFVNAEARARGVSVDVIHDEEDRTRHAQLGLPPIPEMHTRESVNRATREQIAALPPGDPKRALLEMNLAPGSRLGVQPRRVLPPPAREEIDVTPARDQVIDAEVVP